MKKHLSFIAFLFTCFTATSQTTAISDANFEQALINLGLDNGPVDGTILTSNISNLEILDISGKNISNLKGLEDFQALKVLKCNLNNLYTLDVSKNLNLTELQCGVNYLTKLNLSSNVNLMYLQCNLNNIDTLNFEKNTELIEIKASENKLRNVNVDKNTKLLRLYLWNNRLTSLSIKNGNNLNMTDLTIHDNENLHCVELDDLNANITKTIYIDPQTKFNLDCKNASAGIVDNISKNELEVKLYPNPTQSVIQLELNNNIHDVSVDIYDFKGLIVSQTTLHKTNNDLISIDIHDLEDGIYLVKVKSNTKFKVFKLTKLN